jgi:hypothetical protein
LLFREENHRFLQIQIKGTLNVSFVTFFLDEKSNQKNQGSKEIYPFFEKKKAKNTNLKKTRCAQTVF